MIEKEASHVAASIGGTIVATLIAVVAYTIVAVLVGVGASFFNYYMSSMRIEAATFFGGIIGGYAGVIASRASCDAVIRSYSGRAVFVVFSALAVGQAIYEIDRGISWATISPLAQWIVTLVSCWGLFWKEEAI